MNQPDATKACQQRGAVLHSVKDFEELIALKSLIDSPDEYWVSAKRNQNGRKYLI